LNETVRQRTPSPLEEAQSPFVLQRTLQPTIESQPEDSDIESEDDRLYNEDLELDQLSQIVIDLPPDAQSVAKFCERMDIEEFGEDEMSVSRNSSSPSQRSLGRLVWEGKLLSNSEPWRVILGTAVLPDIVREELLSQTGRRYQGYSLGRHGGTDLEINIGPVKIRIPRAVLRTWAGDFYIAIDIPPEGQSHPHRYYSHGMDLDDIGNRLGIQLLGEPVSKMQSQWIFARRCRRTIFKLNSLADWLQGYLFYNLLAR
jgi:hypothetical protein